MTASVRPNPLAQVQPSARVRLAARLYASGACKTKREASKAAGLHPNYFAMLTAPNGGSEPVKRLISEVDKLIEDQTVETSKIIELLGRKALGKIAHHMEHGSERISLLAAQDLADRAPASGKTQKLQVESFTLGSADVAALASAMVEAARVREEYSQVALDGLVEIEPETRKALPAHAQEQARKQEDP